ncbi:hypothetical protein VNO80_08467 [Phaseolus coccineus]|uniref:Leucine-rich repeat-containing N-terminal plant-type domain-containing protein n=1 Tax=Phaseolus coccineus TaxID=3886 RepID=A0AAN9N6B5_PHACN
MESHIGKMPGLVLLSVLFLLLQHPLSSFSNSEGDALYAFRQALSDPNHVLDSWDPTLVDPCTWFHITCDSNNHVIRLDLFNYDLVGSLSPELGQLPYLQYLELNQNKISGKIPQELGNLNNLISMDLSHNQLEGNIPLSFGNLNSLKFLWLNNNQLTGSIPKQVTDLHLQVLDVSGNHISTDGNIPNEK